MCGRRRGRHPGRSNRASPRKDCRARARDIRRDRPRRCAKSSVLPSYVSDLAREGSLFQCAAMRFLSDSAASVHPKVWAAMQAADAADAPYDGDKLSARLDAAFSELFGTPCAALWVASGTAANCLALTTMVAPHGGVVCHRELFFVC